MDSSFIVANILGSYMESRTFKDQYNQLVNMAGLRHFTFHALRRAMEQGMAVKTLSVILGHASVSFAMDTYAHVLTNHKVESMAMMGELYDMGQAQKQKTT